MEIVSRPRFLSHLERHCVFSRGINISEEEAKFGEQNAANLRSQILASGDEKLINILRVLPEEAYGRLASIFKETA